jgi:beta-mannosidase
MRPAPQDGPQRVVLGGVWRICSTTPGRCTAPDQLDGLDASAWLESPRMGTAAAMLRDAGRWSLDGTPRRFDAEDWWYCTSFVPPTLNADEPLWLGFDGLATVADVWLNGHLILHSSNMFVAHVCEVAALLVAGENRLAIRFHALDPLLAAKRPRPRWRAPMVPQQQLRWHRTTLLGRTPGWSPPVAPVGPVGGIWWERGDSMLPLQARLHATVDADGRGHLRATCALTPAAAARAERIELEVAHGAETWRVPLVPQGGLCEGSLTLERPALWWPHTHGEPVLYHARLVIHRRDLARPATQALRPFGFRRIEADTEDGRFGLRVNGVPVFCRGACWTPLDVITLEASPEALRIAVQQARDAGMNMLRVGGTMVYEGDAFFDACDALGMLVWQEFMFANMDYPGDDSAFLDSAHAEVAQQTSRWQGRACVAVVCGNSEVAQQAAMWGAPRELWAPELFHSTLRQSVEKALPGVPYWPSSACGGAFPHQANAGTASYYGVGAYLRPLEDARRAELSFATECLAFANVPDERTLARMPGGLGLRVHHPGWKERTPRDLNAGWDFEDVRDHYLSALWGIDPVRLRSVDHDRYLALSRVVTGEVMASAFTEWRRPGSRCGGALVWFLRDLWAGAGWGLVDDEGMPKPCYHALRRTLQPVALLMSDEGVNGIALHLLNERPEALSCRLSLRMYNSSDALIEEAERPVTLPPRGGTSLMLAELLAGFTDVSYAYRFGTPPVSLVHAAMLLPDGQVLSEAFHLPCRSQPVHDDLGLTARYEPATGELLIATTRFAQHVHVVFDEHLPADNDFHLPPGGSRVLALRRVGDSTGRVLKGSVWALNAARPVPVVVPA